MYELSTQDQDVVTFIGSESDASRRTWIVFGRGYTDAPTVLEYARRAGYTITDVEQTPEDYTTAVTNLEAYPIQKSSYGRIDGADPTAKWRFTGTDGHTQVDVRDIIAGQYNTNQ